jgi:hypothetical protein
MSGDGQTIGLGVTAGHTTALLPHGPCRNCDAPATGTYCANCGQAHDTHRRSVFRLLRDLFEDIASFDSRVMRTALALLFEPGELPKAFREGRTHRYMPALRLYFFVSLVFFLILSTAGFALVQFEVTATSLKITRDAAGNYFMQNPNYDPNNPGSEPQIRISKQKATRPGGLYTFRPKAHFFSRFGIYSSKLPPAALSQLKGGDAGVPVKANLAKLHIASADAVRAKADVDRADRVMDDIAKTMSTGFNRLVSDPAAINTPLTTWIPRILFLLMPIYALVLALFYLRQRKRFFLVDHLIFSLNVHTFFFVLLIVDIALAQILSGSLVVDFTMGALAIYVFVAMKRFYAQSWFWTAVKFVTISFVYSIFFLAPALFAAMVLSFAGASGG